MHENPSASVEKCDGAVQRLLKEYKINSAIPENVRLLLKSLAEFCEQEEVRRNLTFKPDLSLSRKQPPTFLTKSVTIRVYRPSTAPVLANQSQEKKDKEQKDYNSMSESLGSPEQYQKITEEILISTVKRSKAKVSVNEEEEKRVERIKLEQQQRKEQEKREAKMAAQKKAKDHSKDSKDFSVTNSHSKGDSRSHV